MKTLQTCMSLRIGVHDPYGSSALNKSRHRLSCGLVAEHQRVSLVGTVPASATDGRRHTADNGM